MSHSPTLLRLRLKRWLRCAALVLVALVGIYAAFLLLGFISINGDYQLPPADDRVRIFIRNNEIHTDVVMPTVHEGLGIDWRELFPPEHFDGDVEPAPYVSVGWGNRKFFVETPTWADLKISSVFGALFWPSESVLHVDYLLRAAPGPNMREVLVTGEQYRELTRFIRSSVGECDQHGCAKTATETTYGITDRFYLASGRYHCFNTCNQWTGRAVASAGVPVGIWTPLKQQVLCWLPTSPEQR